MLQPPPPQPLPSLKPRFLQFVAVEGVSFGKALAALALAVVAGYSPLLVPFKFLPTLNLALHLLTVLVLAMFSAQYAAYRMERRLTRAMLSVPLAGVVVFAFLPWHAMLVASRSNLILFMTAPLGALGLAAAFVWRDQPFGRRFLQGKSQLEKGVWTLATGIALVAVIFFYATYNELSKAESSYIALLCCLHVLMLGFLRIYSGLSDRRPDRMGWPQAGWGMTSIALMVFGPVMVGVCFWVTYSLTTR